MSSWSGSTAKPTKCICSCTNLGDLDTGAAAQGGTAYAERREGTGSCVRARMRGHPWSPSYFAVSCKGAPLSIITHYIDGQAPPLTAALPPATIEIG